MIKKLLSASLALALLLPVTPIQAKEWPDPGFNHITVEDKSFSSNKEALDYAQKNASKIASKYHANVEYEVVLDAPGKYRAVFYGYEYTDTVIPTPAAPSKEVKFQVKVTAGSLNVRKWAGTSYDLCSFSPLAQGTVVDVCDEIDGWYYICYNGKYGFIFADYTEKVEKEEAPSTGDVLFRGQVVVDELNVRVAPGVESKKATWGPITYNMLVDVIGKDKKDATGTVWYEVRCNDNQTGFVSSDYLVNASSSCVYDAIPDQYELDFAKGKIKLVDETRYFTDEASALAWAGSKSVGSYLWSTYKTTVYYYVAYAAPNCYAIHFYR